MVIAVPKDDFTLQTLPLIDIGGLRGNDPASKLAISRQIGKAAQDIGFLRIHNHGIDPTLIEATYGAAKRFFALPESAKLRHYIGNSPNHRGYVPFSEKGDYADEVHRNYEAFDLGLDLPPNDPDFMAGNPILGPNVWPDLAGFKDTVSRYYTEIAAVGRLLCSSLELYLGLPAGSFTDQMTKPISQLRLLHYLHNGTQTNPRSVNMGAHTDYECLTLLHTRNEGLQVMTPDNRWIDVPVDQSVYVVNIGDMLEAWSNGILKSTPHRVINRSPERFSMPYFVAANHDTLIRPFAQLTRLGERSTYAPFYAGDHLTRMLLRDFPYLRERHRRTAPEPAIQNPFENRIQGSNV